MLRTISNERRDAIRAARNESRASTRTHSRHARGASGLRIALVVLAALACGPVRAAPPPELGELKGKVVWVDFWASWCVPCRRSFPWMNSMQQRYGAQGLQIIGVNLDDDRGAANKFLEETPASFMLKFDPGGVLARKFDVKAMPSSFLLDAAGNVLAKHSGFRLADEAEYEAQIRSALASQPKK